MKNNACTHLLSTFNFPTTADDCSAPLSRSWQLRVHTIALFFALTLLMAMAPSLANAQSVSMPIGFSETAIATDIQKPVGMEISPDGRIFVLAGSTRRIEIFDDSGYLNEFIRLPQALNLGSGLIGFTILKAK